MQRTSVVVALTSLALLGMPLVGPVAASESGCPAAFSLIFAGEDPVDRNQDGSVCVRFTEGGPILLDNTFHAGWS